jgi:hypothetical protein
VSDREKSLALLTEIRDAIRKQNDLLVRLVSAAAGGGTTSGGAVASDADLQGQHGDPQIKMRVRDWTGPDMKGKRASQCPPEFLDLYSDLLEWAAGKEETDPEKKRYAPLTRKDAARCRAWSQRIRSGKHQAASPGDGGGATGQGTGGDEWGGGAEW